MKVGCLSKTPKIGLGFSSIIKKIGEIFDGIEDTREKHKIEYMIRECAMSAYACVFMQDKSFLQFQKKIQK